MRRSQPQVTTAFICYPVTLSAWMHLGQRDDRGWAWAVRSGAACTFVFSSSYRFTAVMHDQGTRELPKRRKCRMIIRDVPHQIQSTGHCQAKAMLAIALKVVQMLRQSARIHSTKRGWANGQASTGGMKNTNLSRVLSTARPPLCSFTTSISK